MSVFIKGLAVGIAIAVPVGPVGVLCVQRTLSRGKLVGLISGLGAATADALYGLVAGLGLTIISSFLVEQQLWLRLAGGFFLIGLGVRAFLARPEQRAHQTNGRRNLVSAFMSTLVLTFTNPLTIVAFAAMLSGMGLVGLSATASSAGSLILGVFLGSACWWLAVSLGAGVLRAKLGERAILVLNRVSGVVIFTFGLIALGAGLLL